MGSMLLACYKARFGDRCTTHGRAWWGNGTCNSTPGSYLPNYDGDHSCLTVEVTLHLCYHISWQFLSTQGKAVTVWDTRLSVACIPDGYAGRAEQVMKNIHLCSIDATPLCLLASSTLRFKMSKECFCIGFAYPNQASLLALWPVD